MKKDIKFTLIIPIYNVDSFLEKCLNSITNQTYKNFEGLLINDHSKDNSKEIISKYIQRYPFFQLIENTSNMGIGYSRNQGLKHANGEYILFIDSDDFIEKKTLEILNKNINMNNNPEIVIFDYYQYINKNLQKHHSNTMGYRKQTYNNMDLFHETSLGYFFPSPINKAFSKNFLIKNNLFFLDNNEHQDIEHSIKSSYQCRNAIKINEYLYYHVYRKNEKKIDKNYIENYFRIIDHLKLFFQEKQLSTNDMDVIYELFFMIFSNYIFKINHYFETPNEKKVISKLYYKYLNQQINKEDEFSEIFYQIILDLMGRQKQTLWDKKIQNNPWYPILFKTRKRRVIFILGRISKTLGIYPILRSILNFLQRLS